MDSDFETFKARACETLRGLELLEEPANRQLGCSDHMRQLKSETEVRRILEEIAARARSRLERAAHEKPGLWISTQRSCQSLLREPMAPVRLEVTVADSAELGWCWLDVPERLREHLQPMSEGVALRMGDVAAEITGTQRRREATMRLDPGKYEIQEFRDDEACGVAAASEAQRVIASASGPVVMDSGASSFSYGDLVLCDAPTLAAHWADPMPAVLGHTLLWPGDGEWAIVVDDALEWHEPGARVGSGRILGCAPQRMSDGRRCPLRSQSYRRRRDPATRRATVRDRADHTPAFAPTSPSASARAPIDTNLVLPNEHGSRN